MSIFNKFIGESIELSISSNRVITGMLIDIGSDLIVIYDGEDFLYIPKMHIHCINISNDEDLQINKPDSVPINSEEESFSLRKILINAKGLFSEAFITSNQSIHGYVTHVMNDYFIFFSPIYKVMFIPMHHLKWLIPYKENERPYALTNDELPLIPFTVPLARSFTEQCKKYEGKLVIFDLGRDAKKIGKLDKLDHNQIQLTIGRNETVFLNIQHIKTVHLP